MVFMLFPPVRGQLPVHIRTKCFFTLNVAIVFEVLIDFAKSCTTSTPLQREDATNAAAPPIRPGETLLRYVL